MWGSRCCSMLMCRCLLECEWWVRAGRSVWPEPSGVAERIKTSVMGVVMVSASREVWPDGDQERYSELCICGVVRYSERGRDSSWESVWAVVFSPYSLLCLIPFRIRSFSVYFFVHPMCNIGTFKSYSFLSSHPILYPHGHPFFLHYSPFRNSIHNCPCSLYCLL